jgi:hypothetical protein
MEQIVSNPQDMVLDLLYGRWRSQTLHAGVELGFFEVIGSEPIPLNEIASGLNLDSALSYRLLRALGSLELLNEYPDRYFSVTEAGKLLRSDHPQSLRDMVLLREGPEHTAVWKHLPDIVRDGIQNGFVREFGCTAFDYAAHEPGYSAAFNAGMSSQSRLQTAWVLQALHDYDFSSITHLCDVGGGQGHLLSHLLVQYPHLKGTVLERSSVLESTQQLWAEKLNVGDRCQYVAGDMFVDVPSADAYIMKMILHDWNDQECIRILRNINRRAAAGSRIFIVEHVISELDKTDFAVLFDIHMLCWGTGRERTEQEYAGLLREAGWNYAASWFPPNKVIGVIEGAKS